MTWAPDYASVAELKSFLRISDADDDTELGYALTAASRAVDSRTNRQFGSVSPVETRLFTAQWSRRRQRWIVPIDDVQDTTGLAITVVSTSETITDYTLEPVNASAKGRPYEGIVVSHTSAYNPTATKHDVSIDALWGWSSVPAAVKQATLLQASRFHARRFSPYGIAGSPDTGSEMRLLARVDPDVSVALTPYVRWWAAA